MDLKEMKKAEAEKNAKRQ